MLTARSSGRRAASGSSPSDSANPSASSSSWPGRAHRHCHRSAADPKLQRLLDRQPVVDLVSARQPEHADDGGIVGRWRLPLPRHRAATVPGGSTARRRPGTDDAVPRPGRRDVLRRLDRGLRAAGGLRPLARETVGLELAAGRVTAEAIFALRSAPAFDAAAMDGIAVAARSTEAAPATLTPDAYRTSTRATRCRRDRRGRPARGGRGGGRRPRSSAQSCPSPRAPGGRGRRRR